MDIKERPTIPAAKKLPEITFKAVIIAIILAIILAAANTYLALKIGILTSASIPAAVLAMGILRFCKRSNILETNLIQTCASAGEAIAGGIVYTVPALIIIHYWMHFSYLQTVSMALIGGIIGVFFSIPLRRILVTDAKLHFPEGRAIAEVLKFNLEHAAGFKELLIGGLVGGLVELAQTGFKLVASQVQMWFARGNTLYGFGFGFSATMIGAGYLIGFNVGVSIFIGALISWLVGVPTLSSYYQLHSTDLSYTIMQLWDSKIRYVGIGAMLTAGIWTLITLIKPFWRSIKTSMKVFSLQHPSLNRLPRTDRDMPLPIVIIGIVILAIFMFVLFQQNFQLSSLGLAHSLHIPFVLACVFYTVIIGFIFSAITGYFSGLVGVSASPGSAIIIAGMLIAAFAINALLKQQATVTVHELQQGAAITIYLGAIITGAAAIANDNIQDLKVGYIVGSTPWKQQIMLLLGAIVAALIIPPIMEVLFNVYGIAGVFPHPGMDPGKQLPAPPAALMATITQGVFHNNLPWNMLGLGMIIIVVCILINFMLNKNGRSFSVLGIAIGMYLPLATTTPLFFGSLMSLLTQRCLAKNKRKLAVKTIAHKNIVEPC